MGIWFSHFVGYCNTVIFGDFKYLLPPKGLLLEQNQTSLIAAAAEIAAFHRRQELNNHMSRYSDTETDLDSDSGFCSQNATKDGSDSELDDDDSCAAMFRQRQREIFRNNQRVKRSEGFYVSNSNTYNDLRDQISLASGFGASTSIMSFARTNEIGGKVGRRDITKPSVCGEKTALWNSFFPNCRKVIDKQRTKMFCCQFVKNGEQLAVAGQDECIRFFEASGHTAKYTKVAQYKLMGVGWSILDVAMAPDGKALAYGTWKEAVVYCRLTDPCDEVPEGITFEYLNLPEFDPRNRSQPATAVFSVRFSSRGDEVLAGSSDHGLHVFDIETRKRVVSIPSAHEDDVNAVCYGDEDSHLLYSGGDDGLVKVWDRRALRESDCRPVGIFAGHRDGITFIDSRGDNRFLISNSKDQTIKLWDVRCFSSEEAAKATIDAVSTQDWDYRWQPAPRLHKSLIPGDTSVVTMRGHSVLHTLVRARFSPQSTGQRYVYTGCARGEVVVYDLLTGHVKDRLTGHVAVVRDAAWNPTANEIVSCGWDGVAAQWKWDERKSHSDGSASGEPESGSSRLSLKPDKLCKRRRMLSNYNINR